MKNSRRKLAVLLICIVAIISVVAGTFAWYSSTNSMTQLASIGDLRTLTNVYLERNGIKLNVPVDENGLYVLSTNPSEDNFVGNLRITVNQKGYSNAYVRVKLNVQWTMPDGTVTQNIQLPFSFHDGWYDNRAEDYCVYYTQTIGWFENHDTSIIIGFDLEKFNKETLSDVAIPKLAVTAQSVQINRYPQFWGMDRLPWQEEVEATVKDTTSATSVTEKKTSAEKSTSASTTTTTTTKVTEVTSTTSATSSTTTTTTTTTQSTSQVTE